MDQEARRQNMKSNLEGSQDANQKVLKTPNMITILESRSLRTKKQRAKHQISSVGVRGKKEVWTRGPQRCLGYKK
jgi:hypothetical protein